RGADSAYPATPPDSFESIRSRCREEIRGPSYYERLRAYGYEYGAVFQGIERLWRRDGEALGRLRLLPAEAAEAGRYRIHPALLDACFQLALAAIPQARRGTSLLPIGIERFLLARPPGSQVYAHVRLREIEASGSDLVAADLLVFDEREQVVLA